ncbi:DUF1800 domain-containing protein [Solirhodobacter olei]|uniref:DUF1800 domain-containing protein n=1 Tax=Solirhodobacter olei TaxID=2493082 RepID=UPI000FDC5208|nr:DUF1800 domain-containing protein [Solirhodobacter olei]
MSFSPTLAAIRFGSGLSPAIAPPKDATTLLGELSAPDAMAKAFPVVSSDVIWPLAILSYETNRQAKAGDADARAMLKTVRKEARRNGELGLVSLVQRGVQARNGFRERLQGFWSGHFSVVAKDGVLAALPTAFAEEAIRPHLSGRFSDMLKAVATHPAMLAYLNQNTSYGPHSPAGERLHRGLNENLGREIMELHTLGVGAPYTQTDVRQMAYLLTGLTYTPRRGFFFNARMAEQMTEKILGKSYGGRGEEKLAQIYRALDDISTRPETAHHLSLQLATHFVADQPDPALVGAMKDAYMATGGSLWATYQAMLAHPAAWAKPGAKVRQPFDYLVASIRALGPKPEVLAGLDAKQVRRLLLYPLSAMGQKFQSPAGPNGWPEAAAAWIQPQFLAARVDWAMYAPVQITPDLPDPRAFVKTALADLAGPATLSASQRAESPREGVGLVLASNDFNRR